MFPITQDPPSGSIDSYLIKTARNGVALNPTQRAHSPKGLIMPPNTTAHTTSTVEPLRVVLIKYESILPDGGPCVIRNTLE
jgi:hypothetical protein